MGAQNEKGETPARPVKRELAGGETHHDHNTRQQNAEPLPIEILSEYPQEPKELKSFVGQKRKRPEDGSFLNCFAKQPECDLKSTVFIEPGIFSPKSERNFSAKIQGNIPSHRPANFSTRTPHSGKPGFAYTPGGTHLGNRINYGPFSIYQTGNVQDLKERTLRSETKDIICDTILEEFTSFKTFSGTITKADIQKAKNHKRSSQKSVMGHSAKDEVKQSTESEVNNKWHWMHLIAFFMLGKKSQDEENLVAGTASSNYRHLFMELEVPYLLSFFDEVEIEATAVMLPDSNVAKEILYKIKTEQFEINFNFDAQSKEFVRLHEGEYVHSFVQTYVERGRRDIEPMGRLSFG